jgi:hypothetical protein
VNNFFIASSFSLHTVLCGNKKLQGKGIDGSKNTMKLTISSNVGKNDQDCLQQSEQRYQANKMR